MSRRGCSGKPLRILLDTSFLLPILGFDAGPRVEKALEKLDNHILYYSELSILEALWKISKTPAAASPRGRKRVAEGVNAIRAGLRWAPLSGTAVSNALRLYRMGHRDMVDNILYSIAMVEGLCFLTLDEALIQFLESHKLPVGHVMGPGDLP